RRSSAGRARQDGRRRTPTPCWRCARIARSRQGTPRRHVAPSTIRPSRTLSAFQGLALLAPQLPSPNASSIDSQSGRPRQAQKDPHMKRRTFLQGGAMGVAGLSMTPALAHYQSNGRHPTPEDLGASVSRLRKQFLEDFEAAYVDNVIIPYFLVSTYHG